MSKMTIESMRMSIARAMEDYRDIEEWSAQNCLNYSRVPIEFSHLPEAQEALEILNSPLFRALNEGDE